MYWAARLDLFQDLGHDLFEVLGEIIFLWKHLQGYAAKFNVNFNLCDRELGKIIKIF